MCINIWPRNSEGNALLSRHISDLYDRSLIYKKKNSAMMSSNSWNSISCFFKMRGSDTWYCVLVLCLMARGHPELGRNLATHHVFLGERAFLSWRVGFGTKNYYTHLSKNYIMRRNYFDLFFARMLETRQ